MMTSRMKQMTSSTVDKIVEAIDQSTMLGAGWDCLSDIAKERFRKKLQRILDDAASRSPPPSPV